MKWFGLSVMCAAVIWGCWMLMHNDLRPATVTAVAIVAFGAGVWLMEGKGKQLR